MVKLDAADKGPSQGVESASATRSQPATSGSKPHSATTASPPTRGPLQGVPSPAAAPSDEGTTRSRGRRNARVVPSSDGAADGCRRPGKRASPPGGVRQYNVRSGPLAWGAWRGGIPVRRAAPTRASAARVGSGRGRAEGAGAPRRRGSGPPPRPRTRRAGVQAWPKRPGTRTWTRQRRGKRRRGLGGSRFGEATTSARTRIRRRKPRGRSPGAEMTQRATGGLGGDVCRGEEEGGHPRGRSRSSPSATAGARRGRLALPRSGQVSGGSPGPAGRP